MRTTASESAAGVPSPLKLKPEAEYDSEVSAATGTLLRTYSHVDICADREPAGRDSWDGVSRLVRESRRKVRGRTEGHGIHHCHNHDLRFYIDGDAT